MVLYAVARGRIPGIYNTWAEAKQQSDGYSGARFKKFNDVSAAKQFIRQYSDTNVANNVDTKAENNVDTNIEKDTDSVIKPNIKSMGARLRIINHAQILTKEVFSVPDKKFHFPKRHGVRPSAVYVDGGARHNGKPSAVGGYGVYFSDNHRQMSVGFSDCTSDFTRATNQVCELLAIRHALSVIYEEGLSGYGEAPVVVYTIYSDSQYSINCLTRWYKSWESNGWRSSSGNGVSNKKIIQQCLALMRVIETAYQEIGTHLVLSKVRGHSGDPGNTKADELANLAMDREEATR